MAAAACNICAILDSRIENGGVRARSEPVVQATPDKHVVLISLARQQDLEYNTFVAG